VLPPVIRITRIGFISSIVPPIAVSIVSIVSLISAITIAAIFNAWSGRTMVAVVFAFAPGQENHSANRDGEESNCSHIVTFFRSICRRRLKRNLAGACFTPAISNEKGFSKALVESTFY